jgi:actin-related protein
MVASTSAGKVVVGQLALEEGTRAGQPVITPIDRGIVTDWDTLELVLRHTFSSELRADPAVHPLLIAEPLLNPRASREKLAELLFKTFDVPALYMADAAVLALAAVAEHGFASAECGMVVDSGDGTTHVVPVYEGHVITHAVQTLSIAGDDLTKSLMQMIGAAAEAKGYSFNSTLTEGSCNRGERAYHTARKMKEVTAYVALDFEAEVAAQAQPPPDDAEEPYDLPNGESLLIGNARFWAPEALFLPALLGRSEPGLPELVVNAVSGCDRDLTATMYGNVVLSGGTTLLPGLGDRLEKELRELQPAMTHTVVGHGNRRHGVWAGGAALAANASFPRLWVSKQEYVEIGPKMLARKFI